MSAAPTTFAVHCTPLAAGPRRPLHPGTRICDLVPPATPGAMVQVDGAWLLRADWQRPLQPGQHLDVHLLPAGNDGRKALRFVLQVAAFFVLGPSGAAGLSGWQSAAAIAAANLALNALLPMQAGQLPGAATAGSPTYNTNLSGNRAALDEPIPVLYGRNRTFPPFAAEPYVSYDNATSDQHFYALLCLGLGEFTIESLSIDDTLIDNFDEVEYTVLAPGEAPTVVNAAIVTAPEVADLPINAGRATPAITACRGGLEATRVEVDIVFPGGLGDATGSSVTNYSVSVRVDWRPVDDWGVPLAAWAALGTETITAASTEPVRRTYTYSLAGSYRPEVRLVRTTPRDDDPLVRNDASWTGLRAVLDATAPLAAAATHIEIKMRATEQLNGLTQRRLAVISRRKLKTWDPDTGWSASTTETRSIAWALCDKLRSTVYGNGLPDARIDLQSFHDLDATWADRQDHLDVVFDTTTESDEADQLMARAGRARCVWRNGVRTIVRDEPQAIPAAAYTGRDIVPGSVSLRYGTDVAKVPDAIIVQYLSHRTWEWATVTCKAPGVVTPTNPEYLRLLGVTGSKQAEREGLYEAAARAKRRKFASFTTELQGLLPSYGSSVVVSLPLRSWSQHGDVVSFDPATLEMVLTEPPEWAVGEDHYLTLVRPNGQPTDGILVTEGADAYTVVLAEAPDFDPITDDSDRERTRWIFGATTAHRREMLVLGITPQSMREDDGAMLVDVLTVNDDDAIHTADAALLPGVGETQDPIDSPNEDVGGGEGVIVPYLTSRTVTEDIAAGLGTTYGVTMRFKTDGTLQFIKSTAGTTSTIANQWVIGSPLDPGDLAAYEVRATVLAGAVTSGTTGSWLAMSSQRDWAATGVGDGSSASATLRMEVRDASAVVQATATITIGGSAAEFGGG